jgi:hypothetical protein
MHGDLDGYELSCVKGTSKDGCGDHQRDNRRARGYTCISFGCESQVVRLSVSKTHQTTP